MVEDRFVSASASDAGNEFSDSENIPEGSEVSQATIARLKRCAAAAEATLDETMYTADVLEGRLGEKLDVLFSDLPSSIPSLAWAAEHGGFALRKRAVHVFTEAARVLQFEATCKGPGSVHTVLDNM